MKAKSKSKLYFSLTLLTIIGAFVVVSYSLGCFTTEKTINQPASNLTPEHTKIIWKFERFVYNEFETPHTKVNVEIVNGLKTQTYDVGVFLGNFERLNSQDSGWKVPEKSMANYFGWFAGSGEILSLVRTNKSTLSIMKNELDEGFREGNQSKYFQFVAKFKIDPLKKIEISEIFIDSKDQLSPVPSIIPAEILKIKKEYFGNLKNYTSIKLDNLFPLSVEGNDAKGYFQNERLKGFDLSIFGETFKIESSFSIASDICVVVEKKFEYKEPINISMDVKINKTITKEYVYKEGAWYLRNVKNNSLQKVTEYNYLIYYSEYVKALNQKWNKEIQKYKAFLFNKKEHQNVDKIVFFAKEDIDLDSKKEVVIASGYNDSEVSQSVITQLYVLRDNDSKIQQIGRNLGSPDYTTYSVSLIKLEGVKRKFIYSALTNAVALFGFQIFELKDNSVKELVYSASASGSGEDSLIDRNRNGEFDGYVTYRDGYEVKYKPITKYYRFNGKSFYLDN